MTKGNHTARQPMYNEDTSEPFDYIILSDMDAMALSEEVTKLCGGGWLCVNGHQATAFGQGVLFSQTMCRGGENEHEADELEF